MSDERSIIKGIRKRINITDINGNTLYTRECEDNSVYKTLSAAVTDNVDLSEADLSEDQLTVLAYMDMEKKYKCASATDKKIFDAASSSISIATKSGKLGKLKTINLYLIRSPLNDTLVTCLLKKTKSIYDYYDQRNVSGYQAIHDG